MNKEEMIKGLQSLKKRIEQHYQDLWHYEEILDEVIGALEGSEDCISRKWIEEHKEVISYKNEWHETETDEFVSWESIENAPSVMPERPKGEWMGYEILSECSVCGHNWDEYVFGQDLWYDGSVPNYCPNCGAKMQGVE